MALSSTYLDATTRFRTKAKQPALTGIETIADIEPEAVAVETIDTFERFEELEGVWNDLFDRALPPTNVFQSFNWHWHWCRHYLNDGRSSLRIVAVWSGENLIMLWPLIVERSLGVRLLKWMGAPVSQYGDILIDRSSADGELLESVWAYITKHIRVDVIALEKVRSLSPVASLLNRRNAIVTGCMEAPYLDLGFAQNYSEYEKRYSGRSRKNRRRYRRHLSDMGAVEFKMVETGEEARQLVRQSINVKRDWLKAKGLVSRAFSDRKFDDFFAEVTGSRERPCGCLVSVLTLNSKPVAYDIGFRTGTRYVAHIGAYDHGFERFSPGSLLMEDFLNASYSRGIEQYDLLAPNAEYKMSWADECVALCDYAYPVNATGYVYANGIIWFLQNVIKKTLAHLPKGMRCAARPFFKLAGF